MWLILNQYGNRLTCKQGRFQVKNDPNWQRLSPKKLKGICIAEPGMISTDAIRLAVKNQIPIVILDKAGKPVGRFWSQYYQKAAFIRKQQVLFTEKDLAVKWMINQMQRKTTAQVALINHLIKEKSKRKKRQKELIKIQLYANEMAELSGLPLTEAGEKIMGLEGNLARVYFGLISQSLPKTYRFKSRSRRPAADVFNCSLNYVYGMLYHHAEQGLIQAGLDPSLPIWHSARKAKPALVYDFVEPYRPWADWVCTKLCQKKLLNEEKHTKIKKGGIWLNPEGKKQVISSFEAYLKKRRRLNGKHISREQLLQQDARQFAKEIEQSSVKKS